MQAAPALADTAATVLEGRAEFWTDGASVWLPPQSSTTAHEIDSLFYFILYSSTVLTLIVTAAMIYFVVKYRRRSHADRPRDVHESKWLEISWIVIPTLLVLVVFFWGFRAYVATSVAPSDAYQIDVIAQKWNWTFQDHNVANPIETYGEITVPVGQPVQLRMTSKDVLHSFYVPEFRIKHDVIPGRYAYVWFEAPAEGVYQVLCTEYCGTSHSNMGAKIRVVSQTDFNRYIANGGPTTGPMAPADLGESVYTGRGCQTCHSIDGSAGVGPTWAGLWNQPRPGSSEGVANEAYIYESILNPSAYKVPGYENGNMVPYDLSEDELAGVAAYIRVLSDAALPSDTVLPGEAGAAADSSAADGVGNQAAPDGVPAGEAIPGMGGDGMNDSRAVEAGFGDTE